MKKLVSLFLCLILLMGILPLAAPARAAEIVDSGTCGANGDNLTWTLDSSGVLTISGTGPMDDYGFYGDAPWYSWDSPVKRVVISGSVTSIGNWAFDECTRLASISISDSVIAIGERAFNNCSSLTNIYIPDSVTSIGEGTFVGCINLSSVTIPDSVTSIGDCAFVDCTKLTSISVPDSVTSIGYSAFSGCTSLTSVSIPDSVTSIGWGAFSGCTGLTNVIIPDSVIRIGSGPFASCTSLTKINVAANNPSYCSVDGILFSKDKTTLIQYPAARTGSFNVPDSVTGIGSSAFSSCTGLTSVAIPDSVTSIGGSAFSGCTGLTSIAIPNSVTSIGGSTFSGCTSLTSVSIPDSVTFIGDDAFAYCTNLTSISIPNSVTSIGDRTFSGCTGLIRVTIPSSVTYIGGWAFAECTRLTSVTVPSRVTGIGYGPFAFCTSLTKIYVSASNPSYCSEDGILFSKDKATLIQYPAAITGSYTIPDRVTSIGDCAFVECTKLTSISIPDSVTSIGWEAFSGCTGLTSIVLPTRLWSIADNAFQNCSKLKSIVIPASVSSIGGHTFDGCSRLTDVTILGHVSTIGEYCFLNCSALKSIALPASVSTIETCAFRYCTALTDVYFGGSEEDWNRITIRSYNDPLTSANIHYNSAVPIIINNVSANKTGAAAGEPITWTASAVGGEGALKYYFILYQDGAKVTTRAYSTANAFTYTPAEPGTYRVRVYVKDALDTKVNKLSSGVKVTGPITVTGITADTDHAAVGEAITWSASASGGEGTLQYWFRIYKDGTVVKKGTYGTAQTFSFIPTEPGAYKAKVYVKDAVGTTVNKLSTAVTVTEPLAITGITADKTSAVTGEPLTWTASATGGSGTLKYYFILYKDGTKVTTRAYSTANTFTYTPAEPGTYKVRVYVKDSLDTKVNKLSSGVKATQAITVTGIMADKTSAVLGEAITWSAAAVGGEGTLQYWFRIYKDGTVVKKGTYGTVQAFTYTPTEPGVYKAKVYVKDAVGTTVSKVSTAVTVTEPLAITGITANKTGAVTGAPLTWTAAAAGGTGTLKYYFILYKDGTKITTRAYSTANTFTYTPAEPGTYRVRVYVKDAVETKANKLSGGVTVTG